MTWESWKGGSNGGSQNITSGRKTFRFDPGVFRLNKSKSLSAEEKSNWSPLFFYMEKQMD